MTLTLRFKINIAIAITFIVIAAIFSVILTVYETQRRNDALVTMEQTMADMLEQNKEKLANDIFSEHERSLRKIFTAMLGREQIVAATAYDLTGTVLATTQDPPPPDMGIDEGAEMYGTLAVEESLGDDKVLSFTAPVQAYGEIIGYCNIKHSMTKLNGETVNIVLIFGTLLLTLLALMSGMLNILMSRTVLNPLYLLQSIMLKIGSDKKSDKGASGENIQAMTTAFDDMSSDLSRSVRSRDEIGDLARSFDTMLLELKNTYGDLAEAEKNYRGIFENALEGIFQLFPDGRFKDMNRSLAATFGYPTPDEFLSSSTDPGAECFHNPDDFSSLLASAREHGGVSDIELELVRRDGDIFWASLSARPVEDETGELLRYEGTLIDITERMEKERAQAEREAAEAAANARSEFLDNSGQGFLSFGTNLKVSDEYSRECSTIFGSDIGGRSIAALLNPADLRQEEQFAKNIDRIFNEENAFKQELFISLMPKEINLESMVLEAEYTLVSPEKMMLILTDVTRQKALENEIRTERNKLKFVVSAVRESRDFFDILDDYAAFHTDALPGLLADDSNPKEALEDIYRQVHTFKGLFSQQDFLLVPQALHEIESGLDALKYEDGLAMNAIKSLLESGNCDAMLEKDLGIIREVLGRDFMKRRGEIAITQEQAEGLKTLADNLLSKAMGEIDGETRRLLDEVRNIQRADLRDLLAVYPKAALRLAENLEKEVRPFEIEGDARVDAEEYARFTKALVHVFRNAVDHGIEDPIEREEAGKDEEARLSCVVGKDDSTVVIEISDDGRGLDAPRLREQAVERGLMTENEANKTSDQDIYHVIFEDNFSTSDDVSNLSGRGVGLAAVLAELRRLDGRVDITSEPGKGTAFKFVIPDKNA